jgi:hypothetical protein
MRSHDALPSVVTVAVCLLGLGMIVLVTVTTSFVWVPLWAACKIRDRISRSQVDRASS